MARRPANDEMIQGYTDGLDLDCPEPSANRSHSYRHGFWSGRADRNLGPRRGTFEQVEAMAQEAMDADEAIYRA